MTKTSLCCCAARASKVCRRGPTANACLSGRQVSIHHWPHPIRYCCANFSLPFCSNRRNQPPTTTVIARSRPQGRRRGNLLLHGMIGKYPINIVNPGYSMLIGPYFFVLRCWRFPRQGFALPRNDTLDSAVQEYDKNQFAHLAEKAHGKSRGLEHITSPAVLRSGWHW